MQEILESDISNVNNKLLPGKISEISFLRLRGLNHEIDLSISSIFSEDVQTGGPKHSPKFAWKSVWYKITHTKLEMSVWYPTHSLSVWETQRGGDPLSKRVTTHHEH